MIIAHSSGAENSENRLFYERLTDKGGCIICFENFSEQEAKEYLEGFDAVSDIDD